MKKLSILSVIILLTVAVDSFCQGPVLVLTFTAHYQSQWVMLDSILIENLTQGGDTTIYAPDTVLIIDYYAGLRNMENGNNDEFYLSQVPPNPVREKSNFGLVMNKKSKVSIKVINTLGNVESTFENVLDRGTHSFVFSPGNESCYIITVKTGHQNRTLKLINTSRIDGSQCSLEYIGMTESTTRYKSAPALAGFHFSAGDSLRCTGFARTPGALINSSDVASFVPSQTYHVTFEILEGLPCQDVPSLLYGAQVYKTVKIGDQCWLKENLNVGTRINGSQNQINNSIIEKYCYNDIESMCNIYGGLYQWDEMMQYVTTQGTQGICPTDWHLPTDAEWCQMELFLDATVSCLSTGWRGTDAGGKMKETGTFYWLNPNAGATNASGFTAIPGGSRYSNGTFNNQSISVAFWSSNESSSTLSVYRDLDYDKSQILRDNQDKAFGFSVRCVKN